MLGLIKKDILLVLNNYKSLLIALIMCIFFTFTNNINISFIIPFMVLMIFISTFSYDDYNNFHAYAITLPNGRENVVKSKYVATIILMTLASIISILISIFINLYNNTFNMENIIIEFIGSISVMIIMISLFYPFLFKYGSEKGRIGLIFISFIIFGIVSLFSKIKLKNTLIQFIDFIYNYKYILFVVISSLFIFISYKISKKFYSKRVF